MNSLISFHGKKEVKKFYLDRVRLHRKADELIKGKYWEKGKGCAVGCTIHSGEHKRYEKELGIPEWLARVEDRIFEGLPKKEAMLWPERFLKSIPLGVDLNQIKNPFLVFVLESTLNNFDHKKYPETKKSILRVIELLNKNEPQGSEEWRLARSAADAAYAAAAAAYAADAAAYAAYAAAYAAYAAYAAAADAAAYAADAAAAADAYTLFADKLIELIKGLK